MIDVMLEKYSDEYINSDTISKSGYCSRCLDEKWRDATDIKELYEYQYPKTNELVYLCKNHIGCMEVGKRMAARVREMNDIERHKAKKELDNLIEEGMNLLK